MDTLSLAAFEERAATAEARLAALEAKANGGVPNSAGLQQLRDILISAKEETIKLQQERDAALTEKRAADDEVAKLKYQVLHLKRAVRETDAKLAAKQ